MDTQRIDSLDLLRGFAVLGILLMNVQSFGLPLAAYVNPFALDNLAASDRAIWIGLHLFADMKFMSLFSMLFGVGILVFGERAAQREANALDLHRTRMCWLLLFGALHAYFIWWGDILFTYAICGLFFTPLLALSNKRMLIVAAIFLLIGLLLLVALNTITLIAMPDQAIAVWQPTAAMIQSEIEIEAGSWLSRIAHRAEIAFGLQMSLPFFTYWRVTALMLIGVVLYRTGFLSAQLRSSTYRWVSLSAILLGGAITYLGARFNFSVGFSLEQSFVYGFGLNYLGSIFTAIGFAALLMLFAKSTRFSVLKSALRCTGRMAFTNYILQSVVGLFFFSLLGYFAKLNYGQLLLYVIAMWVLQMALSMIWLARFQQGPLEALWRRLTYRSVQSQS